MLMMLECLGLHGKGQSADACDAGMPGAVSQIAVQLTLMMLECLIQLMLMLLKCLEKYCKGSPADAHDAGMPGAVSQMPVQLMLMVLQSLGLYGRWQSS